MQDKFIKIFKSKNIGIIIYARMSSKRLPGKVLKKIYNNQSTFDIIIDKIKKIGLKSNIVVATSNKKSDKKIVKFCQKHKVKYFRVVMKMCLIGLLSVSKNLNSIIS